jgi:hypothetical protein
VSCGDLKTLLQVGRDTRLPDSVDFAPVLSLSLNYRLAEFDCQQGCSLPWLTQKYKLKVNQIRSEQL